MLRFPGQTLGIGEALGPQGSPHKIWGRRGGGLTKLINEFPALRAAYCSDQELELLMLAPLHAFQEACVIVRKRLTR